MSIIRAASLAFGAALIIMIVSASAIAADMYYYRDVNGKLHLTNVRDRIPARYRATATKAATPQGRSIDYTPAPVKPPPEAGPAITTSVPDAPRSAHRIAPINTRQFGLLQLRMSEHDVLRRLGPPASISDIGDLEPRFQRGGRVLRIVQAQTWYYPGNARIPATRLEFHNGVLVRKAREHQ